MTMAVDFFMILNCIKCQKYSYLKNKFHLALHKQDIKN